MGSLEAMDSEVGQNPLFKEKKFYTINIINHLNENVKVIKNSKPECDCKMLKTQLYP
jgi:hypothetical protein